jgi:Cu+-exporting ATPase
MTTDTRPSAGALLGRLRAEETARRSEAADARSRPPALSGLTRRLVVASALTVVLLALALAVPRAVAAPWVQLVLATVAMAWCAWPLHRAAAGGLVRRRPVRELPSSLGIVLAWAWGLAQVLAGSLGPHLVVTAAIVTFVLAGRRLESEADLATREALRPLLTRPADDVAVLRIDPRTRITGEIRIATDQLVVGDQFVVRTGEMVVADGGVVDGSATLDPSLVTGHVPPVAVSVGDRVAGGAVSTGGRLVVEARTVGPATLLARIQRVAQSAESGSILSTRADRAVDRAAVVIIPVVLVIALAAAGAFFVTGADRLLALALSVLVGASPAALALAIPSALRVSTGRSAELGILIKGTEPLEHSRHVDTVLLEQTGTVTTGDLRLRSIAVLGRLQKQAALKAAAAVAQGSDQPIAKAIVAGAVLARIELPRITDFATNAAEGSTARVNGTEVTIGRAALFDRVDASLLNHARTHGGSTVFVGWDGTARAALTVEDAVRESSMAAVERLQGLGLTAYLLSCDGEPSARAIAAEVGIDRGNIRADVRPGREAGVVSELQRRGGHVAFVGVGQSPAALEQADIGITLGTGTDVVTEPADIVVLRPELDAVADSIELARQTRAVIRQNIAWAVGYNIVALALALAGLLTPALAAAAGALASFVVLRSALRLRRYGR